MNVATITGGVRIGGSYWEAMNYSWPLATLAISDKGLIIKMPFKEIVIDRGEVISISPYRGFISDGLRIEHSSQNTPIFVVFWTTPSRVAKELESLGYPYQETSNAASPNPARPKPSAIVLILLLLVTFIAILIHERSMQRGLPDAVLNATGLTSFLAIIVFAIRCECFDNKLGHWKVLEIDGAYR